MSRISGGILRPRILPLIISASSIFALFVVIAYFYPILQDITLLQEANAVGTWRGQDVLIVPISWCSVIGSPAESNPNVPRFAGFDTITTPPDTTTNAILMRRLERATDNIFLDQAGIIFRSAINRISHTPFSFHTPFSYPVIPDPDTRLATQGDVLDPDIDSSENNQLVNLCQRAWNPIVIAPDDFQQRESLRPSTGAHAVRALNIGLFHTNTQYIRAAGIGSCVKDDIISIPCLRPYRGSIIVTDNHYLFPSVPDRSFPITGRFNLNGPPGFRYTDPLEVIVAHELGHALGLAHRNDNTALMNEKARDNNGDGRIDNIALNDAEIEIIRTSALRVPGVERDPAGRIEEGNIVAVNTVDRVQETKELSPYLDFSSATVTINDTEDEKVFFSEELFGLIPEQTENLEYWTLVDVDNNKATGANGELLTTIGVPTTNFAGAELIMRADVNKLKVTGSAWKFQEGNLDPLPNNALLFDLLTMVGFVDPFIDGEEVKEISTTAQQFYHIISVSIDNELAQIKLGKPFNIQAISIVDKGKTVSKAQQQQEFPIADKLDDTEQGIPLALERPKFPHCFPPTDSVRAGEDARIKLEGLLPNAKIHGLLGPVPVFNGTTDSNGGGIIDSFPIPPDTREGLHLVTIGVDDTAFTADCVINVSGDKDIEDRR